VAASMPVAKAEGGQKGEGVGGLKKNIDWPYVYIYIGTTYIHIGGSSGRFDAGREG